jgi:hypothetical protein
MKKMVILNHIILKFWISLVFISCSDEQDIQVVNRIREKINQNVSIDSILNYKNEYGETALMTAVASNDYEMVNYLIEKNVDVDEKTTSGLTALMIAKELEIIKLLVDNGADVSAKDDQGWSPLIYISGNNNVEQLEYLFSKGADINSKTSNGYNLLYFAIIGGRLEMIEFLINKNISFDINSKQIEDALLVAKEREFNNIINYFSNNYNYNLTQYDYDYNGYNNNFSYIDERSNEYSSNTRIINNSLFGEWTFTGSGVTILFNIQRNGLYQWYDDLNGLTTGEWIGNSETITIYESGFPTAICSLDIHGNLQHKTGYKLLTFRKSKN